MYRKNLMRVCLAAIMAATVVTTSVPVYAAEPVATKQETAKTRTITIKYQEEDGTLVSSYDLLGQPDELGAVNQKVVKSHLPNGCELVNPKDSYEVGADGVVLVTVKNNEKPATKSVKINYYDETAEKTVGEAEVKNLALDTAALGLKVVKSYLPAGYEIVNENTSYAINDGYVYVAVKAVETEKPEKPTTKSVKINYYDETAEKTVGEAEVKNLALDTAALGLKVVKSYLPAGYEIVNENTSYAINDGYVYVAVKAVETEKPEKPTTKSVKINYYDETAEKTVGEAEVKNLALDTAALGLKVVKSYLPAGYELVNEKNSYAVNDGYVYVAVKAIKKAEVKTTLNITFETKDGEVVDTKLVETTVQGAATDSWTFMLGTDFELPAGYKLAEGVDQTTNIQVPFGATAGHTVIVEKIAEVKEVKINFYDEEAGKQVEERTVEVAADATHLNVTKDMAPKGYEIMLLGDLEIRDGYVYVNVKKLAEVKEVKINFYDEEAGKQVEERTVEVAADAIHLNVTKDMAPKGYEIMLLGDLEIRDGYVYVNVKKLAEVKEVKINFYDEEAEKQVEERVVEVAADATYLNVTKDMAPEGYEIMLLGDLPIRDGYVYVAVKKLEVVDPETPVDPNKPVKPEKPEKPVKPQEDDKDKDNQKDDKKDEDDKKSPKTSDEASPLAATATAGLSLAAILALLKKRR